MHLKASLASVAGGRTPQVFVPLVFHGGPPYRNRLLRLNSVPVCSLLRRPYAVGGSMSGARGVKPSVAPGSSTCNLRSAALSRRAAEILGSVVALANPNRIAA